MLGALQNLLCFPVLQTDPAELEIKIRIYAAKVLGPLSQEMSDLSGLTGLTWGGKKTPIENRTVGFNKYF